MASPYLHGPRIASPEFERFVSATLAKYDSRIDTISLDLNRKLVVIKEGIDSLRGQHKEINAAMADSDQRKADNVHRLALTAIESVKSDISTTANDVLRGTAEQLRSRISQELERQIKEGLVDRVRLMAGESIQRGSEQAGLSLRSEMTSFCDKLVRSSFETCWKPELFDMFQTQMISSQIKEDITREVAAVSENQYLTLKREMHANLEKLKDSKSITVEQVSELIHAALTEERKTRDSQLFELQKKFDECKVEWHQKLSESQQRENDRFSALESLMSEKLAHEKSLRAQAEESLHLEIQANLTHVNSELVRLRSQLALAEEESQAASDRNAREVVAVDAELRGLIAREIKMVEDQQHASERRFVAGLHAAAESGSSAISAALSGIDQKLASLESRLIGIVNSDVERCLAKARAASDMKVSELSRSVARFSDQVQILHAQDPGNLKSEVLAASEKANAAIAKAAEVAADMNDIVKPLLHITEDSPSLASCIQSWRDEMRSTRTRIDAMTNLTDSIREQYSELANNTITSVASLQREVGGAISALTEWVNKVRPIDEIQTEVDFYGPFGLANDNLASAMKEMLSEMKRQRSSTEERLSGEILTVRGDLVRLVHELSMT